MALRERLPRLGVAALAIANARRVRLAAQLLLVGGLVFVVLRLHSIWRDSHASFASVDWLLLAGAFAVTVAGVGASGFIWLAILRQLGVKTRPRWAGIFFQAQLAKYIPGTVWQYAGRAALANARSIPMRVVAISLPVELGASAAAAAMLSSLLLGWWGVLPAAALLGAATLIGRRGAGALGPTRVALRAGATVVPRFAAAWIVIGVGFWLTAHAVIRVPAADLLVYVGAFSAAWVVGLLAVYAPGGIGVREAMLVAILHSRIGSADALVVAAVSRAMMALIDVGSAAVGAVLLRGDRPPSAPRRGSLPPETPTESAAR